MLQSFSRSYSEYFDHFSKLKLIYSLQRSDGIKIVFFSEKCIFLCIKYIAISYTKHVHADGCKGSPILLIRFLKIMIAYE